MTLKQLRDTGLTPVQQTLLSYPRNCVVRYRDAGGGSSDRVEPEGPARSAEHVA
jgi:hypothetical protein